MPEPLVSYEVFEEDKPSYFPSYVLSGFVLLGILGLGIHDVPFWPLSLAHVFLGLWFGIAFYWMIRNARQQKLFTSNRLSVTADTFKQSFRYAVAESTFVEIPVSEIEEVTVSAEQPRYVEVRGKSESDMYFLPRGADVEQLVAVLKTANPAIRVTT